jgi:hypothetical protein
LRGDLGSDALSSVFSDGNDRSMSELSLDSPLIMSRRRSLAGHKKRLGSEARPSHETQSEAYGRKGEGQQHEEEEEEDAGGRRGSSATQDLEGHGRLAPEFLTRRARREQEEEDDEDRVHEVLCMSTGSEGKERGAEAEEAEEQERGLACFRRVMGEGRESESMAYMHRLLVGGDDARLAYYHRLLTRGGLFLKEGRQGRLHSRFVLASPDLERLMWRKPGEVEVIT